MLQCVLLAGLFAYNDRLLLCMLWFCRYPCAGGISKVELFNRVDWGGSYAASLSLDTTNNGTIVYTYALDATQSIYDIPIVMKAAQPTFQCSRPKGEDAQAISKGTKTAEQVCVGNGARFFTNGVNNDYTGCASGCTCCKGKCGVL
jgi:hypothetical protein